MFAIPLEWTYTGSLRDRSSFIHTNHTTIYKRSLPFPTQYTSITHPYHWHTSVTHSHTACSTRLSNVHFAKQASPRQYHLLTQTHNLPQHSMHVSLATGHRTKLHLVDSSGTKWVLPTSRQKVTESHPPINNYPLHSLIHRLFSSFWLYNKTPNSCFSVRHVSWTSEPWYSSEHDCHNRRFSDADLYFRLRLTNHYLYYSCPFSHCSRLTNFVYRPSEGLHCNYRLGGSSDMKWVSPTLNHKNTPISSRPHPPINN